jgi:predicted transcriptional regulator
VLKRGDHKPKQRGMAVVPVRLPHDLLERVRRLAVADRRSVSAYIRLVLEQIVTRQGS